MVLSVETTMLPLSRGFFKLEDTLAVTATVYEICGTRNRGWIRGGGSQKKPGALPPGPRDI